MAAKTETLTVTLPIELAEFIRERVASGKFSSENDALVDAIREVKEYSWLPDEPIGMSDEEWEAEIQRRVEALDAGLEPTYTLEEVRQRFKEKREAYLRG